MSVRITLLVQVAKGAANVVVVFLYCGKPTKDIFIFAALLAACDRARHTLVCMLQPLGAYEHVELQKIYICIEGFTSDAKQYIMACIRAAQSCLGF